MFFFSRKVKVYFRVVCSAYLLFITPLIQSSNFKSYTGINGQLRSVEGNGGRSLQATT